MATETGTEASTPDYAQGEAAAIARDLSTQEWVPFIDWSQTHPGNRGVNRQGRYELYDAPVGVRIRVEQAAKSDPALTSNDRWEGAGQHGAAAGLAGRRHLQDAVRRLPAPPRRQEPRSGRRAPPVLRPER